MKHLLEDLITFAMEKNTSDIHFNLINHKLRIEFRTESGLEELIQDIWDEKFFEYVKFISGFDLCNPYHPQSGQFEIFDHIYCRFSVIVNKDIQTGVLRILYQNKNLFIEQLTYDKEAIEYFKTLLHLREGLYIHAGPTNSGKTTTLHAILHEMAKLNEHKIVSLEDPIEIKDSSYLQLQINEAQGFTYEKGIEELLRHDPDVIFIGETRNAYTAHMAIRAALTGHLVLTTIHAKNGLETLQRLRDFGIENFELNNTLSSIVSQRLYKTDTGKTCVFEILKGKDLHYALEKNTYSKNHKDLPYKIKEAIEQGNISDPQAFYDIQNQAR